jgi:hypothetical protein
VARPGRVVSGGWPRGVLHPGEGIGASVKKLLTWLAVAFVIFYVIQAPDKSAEFVRTAGQALGNAASSLATFVGSLA